MSGPLDKQKYMLGKDVFPPPYSRRFFFKRRNSCGHESMVTTPRPDSGTVRRKRSGVLWSFLYLCKVNTKTKSVQSISTTFRECLRLSFGDSRWRQSREKYSRDCRSGGVAFLRGVYRVRMRGVLQSFAYILKRRTATAPNMPVRQKKRGKKRERKNGGKQKYFACNVAR